MAATRERDIALRVARAASPGRIFDRRLAARSPPSLTRISRSIAAVGERSPDRGVGTGAADAPVRGPSWNAGGFVDRVLDAATLEPRGVRARTIRARAYVGRSWSRVAHRP